MIPSHLLLSATPTQNVMPPSEVRPEQAADSSQATSHLLSPRDRYFSIALQQGIIDSTGRFQFPSREKIALDADDKKEILNFWNNNSCGIGFSWNFHTFLKYFVPYFSKKNF